METLCWVLKKAHGCLARALSLHNERADGYVLCMLAACAWQRHTGGWWLTWLLTQVLLRWAVGGAVAVAGMMRRRRMVLGVAVVRLRRRVGMWVCRRLWRRRGRGGRGKGARAGVKSRRLSWIKTMMRLTMRARGGR